MARRLTIPARLLFAMKLMATFGLVGWSNWASADDVNLVPGTTFKQAIGGRVKGQVQSESPSEVVVMLGAITSSVRMIRSSRSATNGHSRRTFHWPRPANQADNYSRAAELFKKAATESAGKPFPVQAAHLLRPKS